MTAIRGFMFGVLENKEDQELINEEREVVGHQVETTIQIALFFITFTFVWADQIQE